MVSSYNYKYLGNIVDNHLSLTENFNKVYKKASNRLRLLSHMISNLTSDARLKIYEMIIPLITYSSSIHLNYNQSQKQKLQSIDRCATNIIENGNVTTSIAVLEIMADHRSMNGKNLAVIGKKSPLVIRMIGRTFFPSNLRASYFFFLLLSSFLCRVYFESRYQRYHFLIF